MHFCILMLKWFYASKFCFVCFVFHFQLRWKKFRKLIKKNNLQTENKQLSRKGCKISVLVLSSTLWCLIWNQNPKLTLWYRNENQMQKGTHKLVPKGERTQPNMKIYVGYVSQIYTSLDKNHMRMSRPNKTLQNSQNHFKWKWRKRGSKKERIGTIKSPISSQD
jgi:hypothetical protein